MKKLPFSHKRGLCSFTLVELLVVMAIIALLVAVSQPELTGALRKAQSVKCAANLRSIGTAVLLYTADNNNTLPQINQTAPPLPYPATVPGLVGVLGSYGITTNSVQCPVDMASSSSAFSMYGSSYEWNPVFDDESVITPTVYISATTSRPVAPSRIRLAMDFNPIHRGNKYNAVFLDGHVVSH